MSAFKSQVRPSPQVIYRSDDKSLKFTGALLGETDIYDERRATITRVRLFRTEGGSLIWSWDRRPTGCDTADENLERAAAEVIKATEGGFSEGRLVDGPRPADDVVADAWQCRPAENNRLLEASTRVWHQAGKVDPGIAAALHQEVI